MYGSRCIFACVLKHPEFQSHLPERSPRRRETHQNHRAPREGHHHVPTCQLDDGIFLDTAERFARCLYCEDILDQLSRDGCSIFHLLGGFQCHE
jgi:hypothetical protein